MGASRGHKIAKRGGFRNSLPESKAGSVRAARFSRCVATCALGGAVVPTEATEALNKIHATPPGSMKEFGVTRPFR
jgi:hypothetical protein